MGSWVWRARSKDSKFKTLVPKRNDKLVSERKFTGVVTKRDIEQFLPVIAFIWHEFLVFLIFHYQTQRVSKPYYIKAFFWKGWLFRNMRKTCFSRIGLMVTRIHDSFKQHCFSDVSIIYSIIFCSATTLSPYIKTHFVHKISRICYCFSNLAFFKADLTLTKKKVFTLTCNFCNYFCICSLKMIE